MASMPESAVVMRSTCAMEPLYTHDERSPRFGRNHCWLSATLAVAPIDIHGGVTADQFPRICCAFFKLTGPLHRNSTHTQQKNHHIPTVSKHPILVLWRRRRWDGKTDRKTARSHCRRKACARAPAAPNGTSPSPPLPRSRQCLIPMRGI